MVRTKSNKTINYSEPTTPIYYSVQDEPVILSKATLDIFLKDEFPDNLIALYIFYYYTAKWQGTNCPKATDQYVMNALKWGRDKFFRTKRKLIVFGLIDNVREKNKLGQVTGWFIKINFIWKNNSYNSQEYQTPGCGKSHIVGSDNTNALSANSKNALSANNIPTPKKVPKIKRNYFYFPLAKRLSEIIHLKKNIEHTTIQINSWANDIRRLAEESKIDFKRIESVLNWYENNIGGQYIPVIESGSSLREKFIRLEAAMERGTENTKEQYTEETELPDRIKNLHR
jgi:hypothetical protein